MKYVPAMELMPILSWGSETLPDFITWTEMRVSLHYEAQSGALAD
jgi:hypothetical protein